MADLLITNLFIIGRKILFVIFVLPAFLLFSGCNTKNTSDMIFTNANIYTIDSTFSIAECMVVDQGKIVAVGQEETILNAYTGQEIIDLEGKSVYPGFIDPHCHFLGYGQNLNQARLFGTQSYTELLDVLKIFDKENQPDWIIGRGWDQNDWPRKEFPRKKDLDEIFPDKPVFLTRIDGHAALVNSEALRRAGITGEEIIKGGTIHLENGEPTGILIDNAIGLVEQIIPKPGRKELTEALLKSQDNCFAVGLTSVGDAGLNKDEILLIDSLHRSGELKMRIYAMLNPTEENINHFVRNGIFATPHLNVRSIKLFADGALGSRGALLLTPYADDTDNKGLMLHDTAYFEKYIEIANNAGYQVNIHCIGDGANRMILNLFSKYLKEGNDKRWRIEHAQIVHPDDVSMFSKFRVVPSVQSTHATSDMYWAAERLGDRIKYAYIYQTLLQATGWIPNGSDFPIEDINPLYGFYAAVARKDQEGYPGNGFQPEEALTREEALRAMTIWAARAAFEEDQKGSLEPGKMADFVVLEKDIMEVPENEIFSVKVLQTFSNGVRVFNSRK